MLGFLGRMELAGFWVGTPGFGCPVGVVVFSRCDRPLKGSPIGVPGPEGRAMQGKDEDQG